MVELKEFIEKRNINKTELCNRLGITRTTLYAWLEEKKPEQIQKITTCILELANSYIQGLPGVTNTISGTNSGVQNQNSGGKQIVVFDNEDSENNVNELAVLRSENELLKKRIADLEKIISLMEGKR